MTNLGMFTAMLTVAIIVLKIVGCISMSWLGILAWFLVWPFILVLFLFIVFFIVQFFQE